jgi:hypothetical protein
VAVTGGPILASIWILMLVQRIETGHWDAFFLIQEKYENLHGSQNPFVATWDIVRSGAQDLSNGVAAVVGLQTAFVTIVLALVLVYAVVRRRSLDRVDSLLLIWAVVTWAALFHAFSVQRGQAALLPLAVLVARLPTRFGLVTRADRRRDRGSDQCPVEKVILHPDGRPGRVHPSG